MDFNKLFTSTIQPKMPYHDTIHKIRMLQLDLLDTIPYKYLKILLDYDDYDDIECKIKDLPNEKEGWTTTQFKFKLDYKPSENGQVRSKKFKIQIEYGNSSIIAREIAEHLWWNVSESESESEEEEEEKDIQ